MIALSGGKAEVKEKTLSLARAAAGIGVILVAMACTRSREGGPSAPAGPRAVGGTIELIEGIGEGGSPGNARKDSLARVAGWALLEDGSAPGFVSVTVDGAPVAESSTLYPRKDVSDFFHRDVGACGFFVKVPTAGLSAGDHEIRVLVGKEKGPDLRALPRGATLHIL
jgi:hypothetical protein